MANRDGQADYTRERPHPFGRRFARDERHWIVIWPARIATSSRAAFGRWNHRSKAGQKLPLAFAGYVIGELNGERPKHGIIVKFDGQPKRVSLHSQYQNIGSIVEVLREWIKRLPTPRNPKEDIGVVFLNGGH